MGAVFPQQPGNIPADDVRFEINPVARFKARQGGLLGGVRDDVHRKGIALTGVYRQGDPVPVPADGGLSEDVKDFIIIKIIVIVT